MTRDEVLEILKDRGPRVVEGCEVLDGAVGDVILSGVGGSCLQVDENVIVLVPRAGRDHIVDVFAFGPKAYELLRFIADAESA